ncbi:MAG: DUF456 domain-containing protein [Treponema sp.]|jgi:uncharacterized protein YqgC (DUF456 family)|nr:DUF456 domain-containing protein [Treponema sp.]
MITDILLVAGAALLLFVGFLGTFVPIIPGAPLAWAGLLLAFFSNQCNISPTALIITAIVAIVVSVLDNFFPILATKKSGGSKAGTIGATLGLIVGLFLGPIGIIAGPFAGAFIGELIHDNKNTDRAFKAAWGAFLGFLYGTGIKMIAVASFITIFVLSFRK